MNFENFCISLGKSIFSDQLLLQKGYERLKRDKCIEYTLPESNPKDIWDQCVWFRYSLQARKALIVIPQYQVNECCASFKPLVGFTPSYLERIGCISTQVIAKDEKAFYQMDDKMYLEIRGNVGSRLTPRIEKSIEFINSKKDNISLLHFLNIMTNI